jgi:hypothetical protein
MTAQKLTIVFVLFVVFALGLAWGAATPSVWAAPMAASTSTPAATRAIKPTRTPRPTATRRPTTTHKAPKTTPTPATALPTRVAGSGKLNPEASFELTQKSPCGLVSTAELEALLGKKLTAKPAPYTGLANGMACEYAVGQDVVFLSVERDDKKTLLARRLANIEKGGCGSSYNPTEAEMKPFTEKTLTEKWKLMVAASNKCGTKYVPVLELGPDAYADNGVLRVVMGSYMMSAEVPGSTEKAIALAKLAFTR